MRNILRFLFFFVLIFNIFYVYSQSDTAFLLNKLLKKHTSYENLYVNFVSQSYNDTLNITRKKVWLNYNKNELNLRAEVYDFKANKLKSITIINNKKVYFVNPEFKRSDLFQFNLMKDSELKSFYNEKLAEFLPTYFISEGNSELITNELLDEIRKKENLRFEYFNKIQIDKELCFGYEIIDYDKNNGFLADKTGNSNDKFAEECVENIYFKVSDSGLYERSFTYFYKNPSIIRKSLEKIDSLLINNKYNSNIHLYDINNDTLKNYFKTISKYNGFETETELADFSIKKLTGLKGLYIDNKEFILITKKYKYQLLGFWNFDCEECLMHLDAINEEYINKSFENFNFIAVNISDARGKDVEEFLNNKKYKFPVVFSNEAGEQYLTNKTPFYILVDDNFNIKDLFYELTEEKLNEILKKAK